MITTSDSLTPKLSFDTILCIVDMLAYLDDIDTLKTFSMVCRIFRPLCAKHIYATIKIWNNNNTGRNNYSPFNRLKTLLEDNPTLIKYIKHLHLWIEEREEKNPNVPIVLNRLQRVNTLLLKPSLSEFRTLNWATIPEPFRMALERHICSPHLIHLEVNYIANFPAPWILACSPSLKILDLGYSTTISGDVHPMIISQHTPVPQLRSLSVWRSYSSTAWELLFGTKRPDGLPVLDMTSLDKLNIAICRLETIEIWLSSFTKLKNLTLSVHSSSDFQVDELKFVKYLHPSSSKTLKHLHFCFTISAQDPYFGICGELELLASAKCPLENIILQLIASSNNQFTTEAKIWRRLEDVLNLSKFPTLRDVTIQIRASWRGAMPQDIGEQLRQMAQVAFKTLAHEPSIKFSFSID